ncbi:MAG: hypothetical protein WD029_00955 [Microthrixaceae bacterium]
MPETPRRRGARFFVAAAVFVTTAAWCVEAFGFAMVVSSQACAGTVSTLVSAASLPGESWEVSDGCLSSDAFFEYSNTEGRAQVAVAPVTYSDGHEGRVAVGLLVLTGGAALSIVGVEDSATGLVKWSAVLGRAEQVGDQTSVSGQGLMVYPVEVAELRISITGTGTNISSLAPSSVAPSSTPSPALAPIIDGNRSFPAPKIGLAGPIDTGPIDTSATG